MKARLHDLVCRQAERHPGKTAIIARGERLTYSELQQASDRLATVLRHHGCGPGGRVCLLTTKSAQAIVGMLATLKVGAAYVPIDLKSPARRVARIFEACEPCLVLAQRPGLSLLDDLCDITPKGRLPIIGSLERTSLESNRFRSGFDLCDVDSAPALHTAADTTEDDLAHILFTSGSTGTPKGVMIAHRNVTSFLSWACAYFGVSAQDRTSGHSPLHFDLSTFDIYGSLTTGAELHLVPVEFNLMANRLAAFIRDARLTQWFSVPSILSYVMQFDQVRPHDFPDLKRLLWCGEVLPTPTLIYWMKRLPHVQFTNLYGPTEATIASSYHTVTGVPEDDRAEIPIGRPCGGERLLVLDDQLRERPPGEAGDLFIAGAGLSPGYWGDEGKTAEAFRANPADGGERIYRTGDVARLGSDGLVYFKGRRDSQIKSRGYRIELGEVEAALNALAHLRESAVVGVETGGFEGTSICCIYVPAAGEDASAVTLRRELAKLLPNYMLPVRWKSCDRLPRNANGKIDRRTIREAFEDELLGLANATAGAPTLEDNHVRTAE